MEKQVIDVYKTSSGRLHASATCSGIGQRTGLRRMSMDRLNYEEWWSRMDSSNNLVMCRCLHTNTWGREIAKRELRARLAQHDATKMPRKGYR